MLPGFIELPIWNPPYDARRDKEGQTPTACNHNDFGQGTTLIRLDSIACIIPIWEGDGDLWSHSSVTLMGGGSIAVDASFEQIEEAVEKAVEENAPREVKP